MTARSTSNVDRFAVVDADDLRVGGERAVHFLAGCGPPPARRVGRPAATSSRRSSSPGWQGGDDQQDGVRAGGGSLVDLHFVEHEILAQQRQIDRVADGAQVIEVSLEKALVGQDGNGVRPGGLVSAGDLDGIEILGDHPGGGRGALDLGDERRACVPRRPGSALREAAEFVAVQGGATEVRRAGRGSASISWRLWSRISVSRFIVVGKVAHGASAGKRCQKALRHGEKTACGRRRRSANGWILASQFAGVAQW